MQNRKSLKYYFLILFIVVFDQISKISIKNYFKIDGDQHTSVDIIGDYLRFKFVENPGIAFGIDLGYPLLLTMLTLSIIIVLFFHFISLIKNNSSDILSIAFVLGGAIGNAIDRLLTQISLNYGGVIDFIDVGIGFKRWPTFNVADMSITIGLILIIYQGFFVKNIEEKNNI